MILSASRRTDIPARHMKWFMERLRDGQVLVRHPMNPHRVSRIFLSPDTIDLIVLITKDPGPLLSYLEELQAMGYHTAFQCTMTPYGRDLEPGLRPKNEIVRSIQELGYLMGKDKVVWRYDPILLNQNFSLSTHERAFERLCGALAANVDHVILSFLDWYPKLEPFYASGMMRALSETEMREAAARLAAAAEKWGLSLQTCCESINLSEYGIARRGCLDLQWAERACGYSLSIPKAKGQREGCQCVESVDIGAYQTCSNGCLYCYANRPGQAVVDKADGPILGFPLTETDVIHDRPMTSRRVEQLTLF